MMQRNIAYRDSSLQHGSLHNSSPQHSNPQHSSGLQHSAFTQRIRSFCARKGNAQGFTFTETLVALFMVVLLSTFVASAIPVANKTQRQVVDYSNAQVALSTTTQALRSELGHAVDVATSASGRVFYKTSDDVWVSIDNGNANSVGLVKHVYNDARPVFNPDNPGEEIAWLENEATDGAPLNYLIPSSMIVGAKGQDENKLRVQMNGNITFNSSTGVFTVPEVNVTLDGEQIESTNQPYLVKAVVLAGA